MANGDDIVQVVKIEVDDDQLKQIGDTAQESFDKLTEQTDKASEALGKLGEKSDETTKDLEKLGEGSGEGLDKLDESTQRAIDALTKLAEDGGHSFEEIQKGADYAGTSLEDFAKLSEKTQETYVEFANRAVEDSHAVADAIGEIPKAADDAAAGVKQLGPAMEGMGESAGHAHGNARALNLILRQFGLGEVGHIIHGLERVSVAFGAVGVAALALGLALKHVYEMAEAVTKVSEAVEKLNGLTQNTPEQLEQMATAFEKAGGKAKDFVEYLKNVTLEMSRLEKERGLTPEQIKALEDGANNADKLKKAFTDAMKETEKWPTSLNDLQGAVKRTIDPMVDAKTAAEALQKALLDMPGVFKDGKVNAVAYEDAMRKLYHSMDDFGKLKMEEIWRKMKVPEATIESFKMTQEEADKLRRKFEDTKWQRDAFKEFAKAIDDLKGDMGGMGTWLAAEFIIWLKAFGYFEKQVVDLFRGMPNDITDGFKKLTADLGTLFTQTLPNIITSAARRLGQYFVEGFIDPIVEAFGKIKQGAEDAWNYVIDAAKRAWENFKGLINDYIVQPVKDAWNAMVDYVTEKANAIMKAIKDAWKDFKQWAYDTFYKPVKEAWDDAVSYISGKVDDVLGFLRSIKQAAMDAWSAIKGMFSAGDGGGGGVGAASGGYIVGPGTSTSDSIRARLSTGEFVMQAAAVQNYGLRFMHMVNSMSMPRFASGGLVPAVPRGPAPGVTGQRTLHLTIEGRTFQGLQMPERTAQSLERFAVHSQIASAGRKQSWRR